MLFGWSGKFYFPEIEIRWPKKNAFDHGNHFTLLFSLQSISGKWERERERESARAWEEKRSTARSRIGSRSRSMAREEDPRSRRRSMTTNPVRRLRHWSRSTARSRSRLFREIAIDGAILRSVDCDLGSSSLAVDRDFFLGCGLCFFGFVLSFFFSKYQKIFSGKFFEMQPNTWKHFPFPENVLQQPNTALIEVSKSFF